MGHVLPGLETRHLTGVLARHLITACELTAAAAAAAAVDRGDAVLNSEIW